MAKTPDSKSRDKGELALKVNQNKAITSSIYDFIRQKILVGEYPPGHALVELTLANEFGVSRTPVREALQRLKRETLVKRGDRGLVVAHREPEEILEIYELRSLLEGAAAKWAATRRTDLDLTRLQNLHDSMLVIPESDSLARANSNRTFHIQFWKASHNDKLVDTLELTYMQLHRYPGSTIEQPGRWKEVLAEHEEIITAIAKGDEERAARAALKHVEGSRTIQLKLLASL